MNFKTANLIICKTYVKKDNINCKYIAVLVYFVSTNLRGCTDMKQTRKVSISVLVLLALLLTGFTWSYWNVGAIQGTQNDGSLGGTIQLGAANNKEVKTELREVKLNANSSQALVPVTRAATSGANAVESIHQSFKAQWVESGTNYTSGHTGVLTATISNIRFQNELADATYKAKDYIVVDTTSKTATITLNGDAVNTPDFVFTLIEPSTKAAYDAINGQTVVYDVVLTVTPTN